MIRKTYHLELISPCFCAGADSAVAEIRPASIRGQLRWWFRVLGGTPQDEATIFGSAAGNEGNGSTVRITVSNVVPCGSWTPPNFGRNDPDAYVWYCAKASGKPPGTGPYVAGPRWVQGGALNIGTTFELSLTLLRPLLAPLQQAFDDALHAFLTFGALGLRNTRGLGAFQCEKTKPLGEMIQFLERKEFIVSQRNLKDTFGDFDAAINDWNAWLKHLRHRSRYPAESPSALGGISPRQTSAIRFRPIKLESGKYTWLAFEAPHDRVLAGELPTLLTRNIFSGAAPTAPNRRR
jgi:hypothetical protein